MDRFFDMINGWTPLGQGAFTIVVLFCLSMMIVDIFKYVAVMIRGWPESYEIQEEEENER